MITESDTDCTQPPQPAAPFKGWDEDRRSELIQWLRSARNKTGEMTWDKKKRHSRSKMPVLTPRSRASRSHGGHYPASHQPDKKWRTEARVHVAVQGMQSAREELERADDIPDMQKATELCSAVVRKASAVFAEKVDSDGSKRFKASSR